MCILVAKTGSIIVVHCWRGGERTFAGSAPAGVLGTRYAFHVLLRIRHVEWNSGDLPPTSSRGWQTKMNIKHCQTGSVDVLRRKSYRARAYVTTQKLAVGLLALYFSFIFSSRRHDAIDDDVTFISSHSS
jgi:hypothetical protein